MNTICATCGGIGKVRASQGFFTVERTCPSCDGHGSINDRERARRQLFSSNMDLVQKFLEIAERKICILDDYGDENWEAFPQEIETCISKIAKRNRLNPQERLPNEYHWLREQLDAAFREYHGKQKAKASNTVKVDGLSGVEFETWLAKFLTEKGFDVRGTPATGDQGADLIAKKNGRTVVVQAKRYQGTVGNSTVQEVIGAIAYYGADEGWVVTNASFTPSAKALAQKTNVRLIDGHGLKSEIFS